MTEIEEKIARIQELRPIDDVFFEALASNKAVCQEMLRTIMEDSGLIVEEVIVQHSDRNLYGRSVRLDALCLLGNGTKVNIEVQRSNDDDHLRRARFNASSITVKDSDAGEKFEDIPELYIIYISDFDFLKEGLTTYHVDKVIRETGTMVDDGLHEIFVNTAVNDGTDIAELMTCFKEKQVENPKFPVLSSEVKLLKNTEGGLSSMCEVMKYYEDKARSEGITLGKSEGKSIGEENSMLLMQKLIASGRLSDLERASTDKDYFHKLSAEFGIN